MADCASTQEESSAKANESKSEETSKTNEIEAACGGASASSESNKEDQQETSTSRPPPDSDSGSEGSQEDMDPRKASLLRKLSTYLANSLHIKDESASSLPRLKELTPSGIAEYIKSGNCTSIIAMIGAGISTSAGIPDFRSPGSGIYANLAQYNLPYPEAVFDIGFFVKNPKPFYHLAKQLIPENLVPTPAHSFLRLLHDKGLLLRVYSQNIDNLESLAGIPGGKLVQAHGSFHTSHCIKSSCRKEYSYEWLKSKILSNEEGSDTDSINVPKCDVCGSTVKPDIVFFGERLPDRFFFLSEGDFPKADLLIIIGTSLTVQPFASLVQLVPKSVPRLAINLTKFKKPTKLELLMGAGKYAFNHDSKDNKRDVFMQGTCDEKCEELVELLGWSDDLKKIVREVTDSQLAHKNPK